MASREEKETTPERKAYQSPSLTMYGQLKDLTAGGSAGRPEGAGGSQNRQRP